MTDERHPIELFEELDRTGVQLHSPSAGEPGYEPPPPDRSKFIGGSDVAAVMGLSPWTTPLELWQRKTHRVARVDTPEKARIYRRGHKLEPFIREMAVEKLQDMGFTVEVVAINKQYKHPGKPYLSCEIDFELVISGTTMIGDTEVTFSNTHINCDAKSVTGFARKKWGDVGTDEVPIEYAAQFMHGLGITTRPWCLVAALRSFDDVDLFWVQYDVETVAAMFDKCVDFWENHVLTDIAPDPVNFADVKLLYKAADPMREALEADDDITQKLADLKRIKATIKDCEEQAEVLSFEITKEVGERPGVKSGSKVLCTWTNERSTKFQQREFAKAYPALAEEYTNRSMHRVLRIK